MARFVLCSYTGWLVRCKRAIVGGSLVMPHQGRSVSHVLHKSQTSEDVHTPSGSRDLDEAAQDARGSLTPEALTPQTGERAYHRGSTARAPHRHGRLTA